jgi:hypothetical protein
MCLDFIELHWALSWRRALAIQVGFQVIRKKTLVRSGTLKSLASLRIAPQFDRFSKDELAATTVDFIARKPAY